MTNPIIQTDIADILGQVSQKLDKIDDRLNRLEVGQVKLEGKVEAIDEKLSGQIKAVDEKLSGQINAVDEKLSGQIKAVDEKLSGQIKALDTKVDQLDKRIGNQEFLNRGIFGGIVLIVLGGAAKLFGLLGNP
jgi:chromosome segregation ATPase